MGILQTYMQSNTNKVYILSLLLPSISVNSSSSSVFRCHVICCCKLNRTFITHCLRMLWEIPLFSLQMLSDMRWMGQVVLLYKPVFLWMCLYVGHSCSPSGSRENSLGHGAWCLCVQWCVSQWKHTWIHRRRQRNRSYQLLEHRHSDHPVFLLPDNNSSIEECRQVNLELACNLIFNYLTLTLSIVLSVYVECF